MVRKFYSNTGPIIITIKFCPCTHYWACWAGVATTSLKKFKTKFGSARYVRKVKNLPRVPTSLSNFRDGKVQLAYLACILSVIARDMKLHESSSTKGSWEWRFHSVNLLETHESDVFGGSWGVNLAILNICASFATKYTTVCIFYSPADKFLKRPANNSYQSLYSTRFSFIHPHSRNAIRRVRRVSLKDS